MKAKLAITRGQAFGCWLVVREAVPGIRGRQRFLCRSTCCGREKVRYGYNLGKATARCVHCKGNGLGSRTQP